MWTTAVTSSVLLLAAVTATVWAAPQDVAVPQDAAAALNAELCPLADGYFPDPFQCDKYYECVDGVPTEKVCPDGQAFKDDNHKREFCEYTFNVECGLRTEFQTAQVTRNCPRANGYFAHPDLTNCNEFYFCQKGESAHNTCPLGLHFSIKTGNCGWIAQAGRTGCAKEIAKNGFECPVVHDRLKAVAHPRYVNPNDCKLFFVCYNGKGPARDSGCNLGLVFDEALGACSHPRQVPECANYYDEYFSNYFSNLFGAPADDEHIQVAGSLGIEIPLSANPNLNSGPKRTVFTPSRRKPTRRRKTTTTTTTTAAPEYEYYDEYYEGDYYLYDDGTKVPVGNATKI
ncbi:unnamed protein product [Meganyctiphanes norvegica]|uniref:Chitin-binding type-2 domain-containing protein n=1 Tax=Meganyctiphanes norvegica TaxID=48144 RepID=A0AAV2R876_MEGNR